MWDKGLELYNQNPMAFAIILSALTIYAYNKGSAWWSTRKEAASDEVVETDADKKHAKYLATLNKSHILPFLVTTIGFGLAVGSSYTAFHMPETKIGLVSQLETKNITVNEKLDKIEEWIDNSRWRYTSSREVKEADLKKLAELQEETLEVRQLQTAAMANLHANDDVLEKKAHEQTYLFAGLLALAGLGLTSGCYGIGLACGTAEANKHRRYI